MVEMLFHYSASTEVPLGLGRGHLEVERHGFLTIRIPDDSFNSQLKNTIQHRIREEMLDKLRNLSLDNSSLSTALDALLLTRLSLIRSVPV